MTQIKSKTKVFISIAQSYLSTYYSNVDSFVDLKKRFSRLNVSEIESLVFDIFNNSRDIYNDSKEKISKLKESFKTDIDKFVSTKRIG